LVRLESFVREAFVRGELAAAIFFDTEKAYDTTWKYGILQDLQNAGLRGRLPTFVSNFLSNRKFNVRVRPYLSDTYKQEMGVPQGSILLVTVCNKN
jgi:Reverse transcriptase (RNA-dependent DNA polymerase)